MKAISGPLLTHLQSDAATLATCARITRRDGSVLAFTTHVDDLIVSGVTYRANIGSYSTSAVKTTSDLAVDNLDIDAVFDSSAITESDLLAGLYDGATVHIFVVNYKDLTQGILTLRAGTIGEVKTSGGMFTGELRGLTQALQQTIGRLHGKRCDADLFDLRCGLASAGFLVSGTVTAVVSRSVFTLSSVPARAGGLLSVTSGLNINGKMEIKSISGSQVTLFLELPFDVAIGDAYSALPGCDKNLSTCIATYANVINFRGYPYIPGQDKVLAYPNAK